MSHPLDAVMLALSTVGRAGIVWAAIAVVGLALRRVRPMAAWQVLLALLVGGGILKPLIHSPRPYTVDPHARVIGARPGDYSFPSGHAATSFAAAVALARAWPGGRVAWFVLAALIALSRVYLGVHFPIDVAGGILIGLACGYFVVSRTKWSRPPA